jgi:signal transduction histidine kinase
VIQGHLEAFADGIFPADAEHLAPVLEQTRVLTHLVGDLRTLRLADAGQLALTPVPTEPGQWVAGILASFRPIAAERNISLKARIAPTLPDVQIDPGRMAQVLDNLLDNGLRYTPPGGRVTIDVVEQAPGVVISVTDSGPGVPAEDLGHLFERFWRGDPSRSRRTGGSGLGLAIARRIVEGHGGRMWAENAPEVGLRVSLSLPATRRNRTCRQG